MPIDTVTYVFIRPGDVLTTLTARDLGTEALSYLEDHIRDLNRRASEGKSPPAWFTSDEARSSFDRLTQNRNTFLAAATSLCGRLLGEMDNRMEPGLFVAVRGRIDGVRTAAILKLQVVRQYAGILEDTDLENVLLEIVRNLLDTPGDLQKGVVIPDARAGSDVVVGDRLADTAQYFLDAMGITQVQKPTRSVAQSLAIVQQVTPEERMQEVVEIIQAREPTTTDEMLESLRPILQPSVRRQVRETFEAQRRPVRLLDPSAVQRLRRTVEADGIRVTGAVQLMNEKVTINELDDGRWEIVITVDERPREIFQ